MDCAQYTALDAPITRLLGIDVVNEIVYGTDRQLSILAKRSNEDFWHFVSESHWNMKNCSNLVKLAIQLPEILIGKRPTEIYQWKSNDGMIWGGKTKILMLLLMKCRYLFKGIAKDRFLI